MDSKIGAPCTVSGESSFSDVVSVTQTAASADVVYSSSCSSTSGTDDEFDGGVKIRVEDCSVKAVVFVELVVSDGEGEEARGDRGTSSGPCACCTDGCSSSLKGIT